MLRNRSQIAWLIAAVLAAGAVWPASASAQRRGRGPVVVVSRPFFGAYADPFFQYGYPWGYPWGSPYGYGYPYGYRYDPTSDIRLIVTPKTADVYVDGNKVGIVDNFDGVFQSLSIIPGPHELVVYQEGYRAIHQQIDVRPGMSYKLQYTMVPLQNGESMEPRPVPAPPPPPGNGEPSGRGEPNAPYGPPPRGGLRGGPPPAGARGDSNFGSVAIRVQPSDATITIDGNPWQAPEGADRLTVQLSGGRHHVEISKPGFKKYSADVDIRSGQTTTLNVSLLQSDGGAELR